MATKEQHREVLQHVQLHIQSEIERLKGMMSDVQGINGDLFAAGQEYQRIRDRINVRLRILENIQSYSGDSYEFLIYTSNNTMIYPANQVAFDAWNDTRSVALEQMRVVFDGVR